MIDIKILVTGGCGFIGTELVRQLVDQGYDVRVADDLSKPGSTVGEGYEFIQVDLTDREKAKAAFEGVDICINLAAKIGGIGYFHKYPATILAENNNIYSSTFDAAVHHKIKRMIYISSSMVFESTTTYPSKEDDIKTIPPPLSAYGFSKLIGEEYCKAYFDQYGLKYSICRPFNAYGTNELAHDEIGYAHVIPDLVKKMLDGQYPLKLLGNGNQIRCFTHVRDIASGIIAVMKSDKAENEAFNISTPEDTKILDLAKQIWDTLKMDKEFKVEFEGGFTYDIQKRIPDTTKAKELLGWQSQITLQEGLTEVCTWLKEHHTK